MQDPKTEQFLTAGRYKWQYTAKVNFSEIDIKASMENPARLYRTVNEEVAFSYALAMEAGDAFPAIVLLTLDSETSVLPYLIATGVHRVYGAREHKVRDWFDAYIVTEGDAYRRTSLIRRLNIIEGYGVSLKDRIAQALQDQRDFPDVSLSALANDWHLKLETLKQAKATQTAVDRGRRFGYSLDDGKLKLAQRSILALGQIHSDKVFDKATHYAIVNGASTNEISELCQEIKRTRDEAASLAAVDRAAFAAAEKRLQAKARHGKVSPAPASQFFGDCRRINNQADKGIERLHLAAYPDRASARSLCQQTIELMRRVLAALDHIERIEAPTTARPTAQAVH
jgi:hypothetical protein